MVLVPSPTRSYFMALPEQKHYMMLVCKDGTPVQQSTLSIKHRESHVVGSLGSVPLVAVLSSSVSCLLGASCTRGNWHQYQYRSTGSNPLFGYYHRCKGIPQWWGNENITAYCSTAQNPNLIHQNLFSTQSAKNLCHPYESDLAVLSSRWRNPPGIWH